MTAQHTASHAAKASSNAAASRKDHVRSADPADS